LVFTSSNGTTTFNSTSTFNVVYRSATTDKVTVSSTLGGTTTTETAWVLKNGTTIAVEISAGGQSFNETGTAATGMIAGVMAGFYIEVEVGQSQAFYAAETQYFHSTGTSTVTIGSNQVKVTNYAANSANELVNECGSSFTYTSFALSIGTPSGTSFPLVTNLQVSGSETVNGAVQNLNYSIKLTAFTVA